MKNWPLIFEIRILGERLSWIFPNYKVFLHFSKNDSQRISTSVAVKMKNIFLTLSLSNINSKTDLEISFYQTG